MKQSSEYHRKLKATADKRRAKIEKLHAKGKSWRQIGAMLGISGARAEQIGNFHRRQREGLAEK